jgi:hypothetical protein
MRALRRQLAKLEATRRPVLPAWDDAVADRARAVFAAFLYVPRTPRTPNCLKRLL